MSTIQPNYLLWGTVGVLKMQRAVLSKKINELANKILKNHLNVSDVFLNRADSVSYYQGPNLPEKQLVLIRFVKHNENNSQLNEEHVSLLLDEFQRSMYGLVNMLEDDATDYISHSGALTKAFQFLATISPSLFSKISTCPPVDRDSHLGKKITFNNFPLTDNVELFWVGKHDEAITKNGKKIIIRGMKVKLYHPKTNSWTWVIVNRKGNIIAFEHHVFWNFEKGARETQMWLHDQWILAQKLI